MTVTTAAEWANAIDAHQKRTGQSAGDIISFGYADGSILGVQLDPEDPAADDERGVVVSTDGWTIRYNSQTGWWEPA